MDLLGFKGIKNIFLSSYNHSAHLYHDGKIYCPKNFSDGQSDDSKSINFYFKLKSVG